MITTGQELFRMPVWIGLPLIDKYWYKGYRHRDRDSICERLVFVRRFVLDLDRVFEV